MTHEDTLSIATALLVLLAFFLGMRTERRMAEWRDAQPPAAVASWRVRRRRRIARLEFKRSLARRIGS